MWMLISGKKLKKLYDKGYGKGIAVGCKLGFQMGQIEARNRMHTTGQARNLMEQQVEEILQQKTRWSGLRKEIRELLEKDYPDGWEE